jgi:hypothetical protein
LNKKNKTGKAEHGEIGKRGRLLAGKKNCESSSFFQDFCRMKLNAMLHAFGS